MTTRELGLVREALSAAGMDISYAYEDLIFLEHNGFLLQFSDNPHQLAILINDQANEDELTIAIALLQAKGTELGLVFGHGGRYRLNEADDGNIQIEFL
ncbi:MAG: hypothetical protein L3J49_07555 [Desulfobulbaceae bacterium]|nr:hypothetical protein [Desulfobulbaceae bacterium]